MVNFIVWLIAGAFVGWLASSVMGRSKSLVANIVIGVVGAFIAGLVLTPYFGVSTINQNNFSMPALLISLAGAVILLVIVNVLRRGGMRLR
jgi:uncharacterized membrane protein YeaQ/YmgE (transglycosylase-associated protein family)